MMKEHIEENPCQEYETDLETNAIPQLDGPAEDTLSLASDKEVMEEDSVKEEEVDLAHLPTADDPESFDRYINQLDQEKIENMSEQEIIHMNGELARKVTLQKAENKKHTKSKQSKK